MRELLIDLLKFLQEDQYELATLKKRIDKMTNSELLDEINIKFKPYKLDINVLEPFSEEEDDIYDVARKMRDDHKNPYNGAKDSTIVDNKDVSFSHPEDRCQKCGGKNPTWSCDNELFNKVNGSPNGIICPACFEEMAKEKGIELPIFTFIAGSQWASSAHPTAVNGDELREAAEGICKNFGRLTLIEIQRILTNALNAQPIEFNKL